MLPTTPRETIRSLGIGTNIRGRSAPERPMGPLLQRVIMGANKMRLAHPLRKAALAMAVVAAVFAAPGQGRALELGLTPSNVVGLWTNVNEALLATARVVSNDSVWLAQVAELAPGTFEGKKPSDVLQRVTEFRTKLNRLREGFGLKETDSNVKFDGTITPSVVFLKSGEVLNGLVDWIIRNTSDQQLVSQFYTDRQIQGMTPSDAFGFVDLATRRLDQIIAKAGA